VEREDVRVLEARRDLDLAEEPFGPDRRRHLGAQDLDRDLTAMLEVLGAVDGGHAAAAELAVDAVAPGEGCLECGRDHHEPPRDAPTGPSRGARGITIPFPRTILLQGRRPVNGAPWMALSRGTGLPALGNKRRPCRAAGRSGSSGGGPRGWTVASAAHGRADFRPPDSWRNLLKGLYDARTAGQRILVTGSARLDFYRRGGDSLQGRYHLLRLHPLSVAELGIRSPAGLSELLTLGGFPEPFFGGSEVEARRWSRQHRNLIIREELTSLERS
jgi:hypothetical protein